MTISSNMGGRQDELLMALQDVVSQGSLEEIRDILEIIPADIFKNDDHMDYELVLRALEKKRTDVALFLIDSGFRVYKHYKCHDRKTPLHCAVELGDLGLVNKMLTKGALNNIGTRDNNAQTPVHAAIAMDEIVILQLFLSSFDVATLDNQCLVHFAVEKSKPESVDLLLHKGFSPTKINENNETPFCIAIKKSEFAITDLLWSSYDFNNFNLDSNNIALTYIASITGNINFLKKSISTGFPINRPIKSCPDDWSVLRNRDGYTLFFLAVEHVQLETVKFLLKNGVDFTSENTQKLSPLSLAANAKIMNIWENQLQLEKNDKIIEVILRAIMKLKVYHSHKQKVLYLRVACMLDKPEILEYFLQSGIGVNDSISLTTSPYYRFSPLHLASKFGCGSNVELLLKHGANVNQEGAEGITPLHVAAEGSSVEVVELLVEHGADVYSKDAHGDTPVHLAFMAKRYAILDSLLSVETIASSNPVNAIGISHFHIACTRNNIKTVQSFIESGVHIDRCVPSNVDIRDSKHSAEYASWYGCSALHFAVCYNNSKIVQILLSNNANVEIKSAKGFTALHLACQYMYTKFIELIQDSLDSVKSNLKFKQWVDSKPEDKGIKNKNESSRSVKICDWSANRKENMKIISLLIKYKSNVNCLDNAGNGPLIYAFYVSDRVVDGIMNNVDNHIAVDAVFKYQISNSLLKELDVRRNLIFNVLFQANVNPNMCYRHSSILHYICLDKEMSDEKRIELAELFLQNGADVNAKNEKMKTPLHLAVKVMDARFVTLLLNYNADVNSLDRKNYSPLHIATSHELCEQSAEIIKLLVAKKPDVNLKQLNGCTALHNLVFQSLSNYSDFEALIYSLLNSGADINAQNVNGETPLFMACSRQNGAVDTLINFGADINIENRHGKNVFHYIYKYQAKPLYQENLMLDDDLLGMLETLFNHLIKLTTMGLFVSQKILSIRSKLRIIVKSNLFDYLDEDEQMKVNECKIEVDKMKGIKIDSKYSLYDMMLKDECAIARHIKNDTLTNIVKSSDLNKTFPIYSSFLERKCLRGLKRCVCMPYAKFSLNSLSGFVLPDICSENILDYLNFFELKNFVTNTFSVIFEQKPTKSRMPLRVRSGNTKYQRVN